MRHGAARYAVIGSRRVLESAVGATAGRLAMDDCALNAPTAAALAKVSTFILGEYFALDFLPRAAVLDERVALRTSRSWHANRF